VGVRVTSAVVEIDDVLECGKAAVVHVGRSRLYPSGPQSPGA
jgi:hypothetical protein